MSVIGFIGAGGIATALAGRLLAAGHEVVLSNSRGPETLSGVVEQLGPGTRAATTVTAAAQPFVVLAVPWNRLPDALAGLPPWDGRIVIDATNPLWAPDFVVPDLGGRTSSEHVADLVPGARLVKAFNTLSPETLAADPHQAGGRRVIFLSGDGSDANAEVTALAESAGYAVVDLGGLASGGALQQFPGGPLPALDLVRLSNGGVSEAAKAVVRRNTEEVQGKGDFGLFEELFADDFVDHTPQPGRTPDKAGARALYEMLRGAFPDFRAEIHWQAADGALVTTYKTYRGTHLGPLFGIAPTGRSVHFETVDAIRVRDGQIVEHWGVANLLSLLQQIDALSLGS